MLCSLNEVRQRVDGTRVSKVLKNGAVACVCAYGALGKKAGPTPRCTLISIVSDRQLIQHALHGIYFAWKLVRDPVHLAALVNVCGGS